MYHASVKIQPLVAERHDARAGTGMDAGTGAGVDARALMPVNCNSRNAACDLTAFASTKKIVARGTMYEER